MTDTGSVSLVAITLCDAASFRLPGRILRSTLLERSSALGGGGGLVLDKTSFATADSNLCLQNRTSVAVDQKYSHWFLSILYTDVR